MRRDLISRFTLRNSGATDNQWNVYVLFVSAFLSRRQSMLSNVITIIGSVNNVCIVQHIMIIEQLDDPLNKFIDSLKGTES